MAAAESETEAKLQRFLQWLQVNGGELRGCTIKSSGPNKGLGIFTNESTFNDDVVMVVPLDLAITPMRVLQDPFVGPKCRALFDEGEVDDRFLIMIFLTVQRLLPDSTWKPYIDMLPSSFDNPLWFTEDELNELKGTTVYRATVVQKKKLHSLYEDKVKGLIEELLNSDRESKSAKEVQFEDFLWANSVFWSRALNIPFPHSYIFPEPLEEQSTSFTCHTSDSDASAPYNIGESMGHGKNEEDAISEVANIVKHDEDDDETSRRKGAADSVWVEGLVPGIDFCNHGSRPMATWEVDATGCTTGLTTSMYLILAEKSTKAGQEIFISYGNKGNEELLYIYGFVIDNNPDEFLMVHYPVEALQKIPFSDIKANLLQIQNTELRCILQRNLLDKGFFSSHHSHEDDNKKNSNSQICNYSWSGLRKVPSYLNRLVFPQEFLTTLRTVAMQENEINQVSSLLEELVGSEEERQPSDKEVQAAIWEACGDYGALELLEGLLRTKMMELEEGTGTLDSDEQLLQSCHLAEVEDNLSERGGTSVETWMNRNKWSSIVYRKGQKLLTRSFLREAEHALELCVKEQQ